MPLFPFLSQKTTSLGINPKRLLDESWKNLEELHPVELSVSLYPVTWLSPKTDPGLRTERSLRVLTTCGHAVVCTSPVSA